MVGTDRVILVGWDGLRPDFVTPDLTPTLHGLIAGGARFAGATAVFPSETRPNHATIGTGCQPGRHGITANYLFAPDVDPPRRINTGDPGHLLAIGQRFGRVVAVPTLGEVLASAGRRLAVLGSGSPGQTLLQNPHGAGWTINRAVRVPLSLEAELTARFGPQPPEQPALDAYFQRAAIEWIVPELDPHLLVLWSGEPDGALHRHGLGSPEVTALLRANDARLADLLAWLKRDGRAERTTLIFISDHGHSTVSRRIDLRAELTAAGLTRGLASEDVVLVAEGIHLRQQAAERLDEIAAWLRRQDWCGPTFVRDDRWHAGLEGTAPASVLWNDQPGRWVPDLQFSMAWDDGPNERGVPGRVAGLAPGGAVTNHGSLSPREMGNVIALAGTGVRRDAVVRAPASTADIAPTVLHLLGVEPPEVLDGRPLVEALEGGDEPTVTTETVLEGRWGRLIRRRVGGASYVAVERLA